MTCSLNDMIKIGHSQKNKTTRKISKYTKTKGECSKKVFVLSCYEIQMFNGTGWQGDIYSIITVVKITLTK